MTFKLRGYRMTAHFFLRVKKFNNCDFISKLKICLTGLTLLTIVSYTQYNCILSVYFISDYSDVTMVYLTICSVFA